MDMTFWPNTGGSCYIGTGFQDPLKGTAFDMTIEENLAMAFTKGKPRGLQWGIGNGDEEIIKDHLWLNLGLGLEKPP
jgi:putative ABC transport system ATP-binding protein